MVQKHISFLNNKKQTLRGIIHVPKHYDTAVLILHGFPSSHEGSTSTRLAKFLERNGILALRFSHSGTPPSDGKFEQKLISQEVSEIKSAIDYLKRNYPTKQLVLFGHSTGAINGALYAHTDRRITKVILSGVVSDLKSAARYDFTDEMIKSFWEHGHIAYDRPETWVHGKRLKKTYYDEFFRLDIPAAMRKLRKPLLIIHGEMDEAIPLVFKDPQKLLAFAKGPKKLIIVKGADHGYSKPSQWKEATHTILKFIGREK